MASFVVPPNKLECFETAAEAYFEAYCTPTDVSHVLPPIKRGSSETDLALSLADALPPCVVLRDFAITNGLFQTCKELGLIIEDGLSITKKLVLNLVVVHEKIGIVIVLYVPKSKSPTDFMPPERRRDIITACNLLTRLGGQHVSVQVSLVVPSKQPDTIKDDSCVFEVLTRDEVPGWTERMTAAPSTTFDYRKCCSILVGVWCRKLPTRAFAGVPLGGDTPATGSTTQTDQKAATVYTSIDEFRDYCRSRLSSVCPEWNKKDGIRPYMLPPMFQFGLKQPNSMSDSLIQASGAITPPKNKAGQIRGDEAEYFVFRNLEKGARDRNAQLITLHRFRVSHTAWSSVKHGLIPEEIKDAEIDFMCLSPRFGITIFEVKASDEATRRDIVKRQAEKAVSQLVTAECILRQICIAAGVRWRANLCRKIVVFPFLSRESLRITLGRSWNCGNITLMGETDHWLLMDVVDKSKPFRGLRTMANASVLYNDLTPILTGLHELTNASVFGQLDKQIFEESRKIGQMEVVEKGQGDIWCKLERTGKRQDTKRQQQPKTKILSGTDRNDFQSTEPFRSICGETIEKTDLNIYFLTPEQIDAWNGPPYQAIVGAAGTGKTVLMLARMKQLVGSGQRVVVFAVHASCLMYKAFARANALNGPNLTILEMSDIRPFFGSVETGRTPPADFLHNSDTDTASPGSLHILLDDAILHSIADFDEEGDTGLVIRLLTRHFSSVQSTWAAVDPILADHLWKKEKAIGVHISKLTTVLRNSREVYEMFRPYVSEDLALGHNFPGMTPRSHVVDLRANKDQTPSFSESVCNIIQAELAELLPTENKGRTLRNAVVLFANPCSAWFLAELRKQLEKIGMPTGTIETQIMAAAEGKNLLAVDFAYRALSLEWPIVIFVQGNTSFDPEASPSSRDDSSIRLENSKYGECMNYMARSRCITTLVEITAGKPTQNKKSNSTSDPDPEPGFYYYPGLVLYEHEAPKLLQGQSGAFFQSFY